MMIRKMHWQSQWHPARRRINWISYRRNEYSRIGDYFDWTVSNIDRPV